MSVSRMPAQMRSCGSSLQVETNQNLAVTAGHLGENLQHEVYPFPPHGIVFGVGGAVDEDNAGVDIGLLAADLHRVIDVCGDLAADNRPHEAHQAVGLPQFPRCNGLHDDQEGIVDLVIQLLRPKLAAEKEADALREDRVEFLEALGVAVLNATDEQGPARDRRPAPAQGRRGRSPGRAESSTAMTNLRPKGRYSQHSLQSLPTTKNAAQ